MRFTRRLLTATSSASKQTKKVPTPPVAEQYRYLVQPRTQWDTIYSCVSSIHSILFNQTSRDSFVDSIDKGTIKPAILSQSVFGSTLTLALHHDMTSDLFKERGGDFNIEEFLVGVEPAIESFTETLYSLDNEKTALIKDQLKLLKKEEDSEAKSEKDNTQEHVVPAIDTEGIEEILQKVLESSSDLSEELSNMISSELLNACEMQFTASILHSYISGAPRIKYVPGSCTILDSALLSARAKEVIPQEGEHEINKDDGSNMEDSSFSNGIDKQYPVAAQVEVFYRMTQSFESTTFKLGDTDNESKVSTGSDGNNDGDGDDDDVDVKEMETYWVAVFETYLDSGTGFGDSIEGGLLRWKLVDNREAWE
eukprot:911692_1